MGQEALMTVTARVPDTEQYRDFSDEVKRIARDEFNYTYDEDPVNPFVAAFHEAVLLYAIVTRSTPHWRSLSINCIVSLQALNETLAAGGNVSNGTAITSRMWGRTFVGIISIIDLAFNFRRHRIRPCLRHDVNQDRQCVFITNPPLCPFSLSPND